MTNSDYQKVFKKSFLMVYNIGYALKYEMSNSIKDKLSHIILIKFKLFNFTNNDLDINYISMKV